MELKTIYPEVSTPGWLARARQFRLSPQALRLRLYLTLLLLDVAAIIGGFVAAGVLFGLVGRLLPSIAITLTIYVGTAFNGGAYSLRALRSAPLATGAAMRAIAFTYGALFLISYLLRTDQPMSRGLLLLAMANGAVLLFGFRQVMSMYVASRLRHRLIAEVIIADGGPVSPSPNMRVIDARATGLAPDLRNPVMLNRFASMLRDVDRVVISCLPENRRRWAIMLKGAGIRGEILVNDFDSLGAFAVDRVCEHQTLVVSLGPLSLRNRIIKRSFDLAFCVPALIALAPIFVITAIAVKLDSPGPVFFRQRRVGRGNAFFEILKFRSMSVSQCDADGRVSTQRDDKRITRVGRFIRRTSIDELPQLLNVLFGQMSIVGPRPHALGSLAGERLFWDVDERYWHRHALKPGITGLAQIRGFRGATHKSDDLTRRLQADLEYIDNWSFWKDVAIVASTVRVIVHHNTY